MTSNYQTPSQIAESISTGSFHTDVQAAEFYGEEVVRWVYILWGFSHDYDLRRQEQEDAWWDAMDAQAEENYVQPTCIMSFCNTPVNEEGDWCVRCDELADEAEARLEESECPCCGGRGVRGLCSDCAKEDFSEPEPDNAPCLGGDRASVVTGLEPEISRK